MTILRLVPTGAPPHLADHCGGDGTPVIGLEWVGSAIGAGVGSLFYSAAQQRFARLYLPAEVRRLQDEK